MSITFKLGIAVIALIPLTTPSSFFTRDPAREASMEAYGRVMAQIGAKLYCTVDEQGVSQCINLTAWNAATSPLEEREAPWDSIYEQNRLNRDDNVVLRCGSSDWTTTTVDLAATLSTLAEAAPPEIRDRTRRDISDILSGAEDAPIAIHGEAHLSSFALACGRTVGGGDGGGGSGSGGNGSASAPVLSGGGGSTSLQQQAADAWRNRVSAQRNRYCANSSDSISVANSTGIDKMKEAGETADIWIKLFDTIINDDDVEVNVIHLPEEKKNPDGSKTKTDTYKAEMREPGGNKSVYTQRDTRTIKEDGTLGPSEIDESCVDKGLLTDACSDAQYRKGREAVAKRQEELKKAEEKAKEEAEKKKKEEEEKKKGKEQPPPAGSTTPPSDPPKTPPPPPPPPPGGGSGNPGPEGTSYTCTELDDFWTTFIYRCDGSEWQEYQCKKLLGVVCADPEIVTPGPDGGLYCSEVVEPDAIQRERAECERRGKFMNCGEEGCECAPRAPIAPREWECGLDPRCTPPPELEPVRLRPAALRDH